MNTCLELVLLKLFFDGKCKIFEHSTLKRTFTSRPGGPAGPAGPSGPAGQTHSPPPKPANEIAPPPAPGIGSKNKFKNPIYLK